jgi:hypothetical protein
VVSVRCALLAVAAVLVRNQASERKCSEMYASGGVESPSEVVRWTVDSERVGCDDGFTSGGGSSRK